MGAHPKFSTVQPITDIAETMAWIAGFESAEAYRVHCKAVRAFYESIQREAVRIQREKEK